MSPCTHVLPVKLLDLWRVSRGGQRLNTIHSPSLSKVHDTAPLLVSNFRPACPAIDLHLDRTLAQSDNITTIMGSKVAGYIQSESRCWHKPVYNRTDVYYIT
ncbi:hypothetical protein BaRGS_00034811 [Batillaria attramentaria]|uniref:Uncharacterized protein n=1 Tax=Batillaria attramentaria TaxID=370345 RepID=A0ABD0JG55_9CAEN